MITTTLFRVPQCQELGEHQYHEDDFSVDCLSPWFYTVFTFSIIMIAMIRPCSLPLKQQCIPDLMALLTFTHCNVAPPACAAFSYRRPSRLFAFDVPSKVSTS
jgi:hypothetical protein